MRMLVLLFLAIGCGGGSTHQRGTTTDETFTASETQDANEEVGPETPEEDATDPSQDPQ